ncbi:serine/threonine protein kinase [Streptomyces sp. BH-SS-21]|uniref:non-specific serine/threonine protein kinase n=1 Tax=Streptomyces liliiviolaceus TaxID=2823109 RepID=A0A940Y6N3_9ACTN|nr:serine/threonine-protein kinase [Streptomyces liliiviolaceus]MBQ0851544.1 serine/threonine protein kinase [Streptomyces liliiviolaceus]
MNNGDSGRRVIDGRFRLEARLGGGGMGTVWRATDLALHRNVAVKEVRPPDIDLAEYDPQGARLLRERVLREARALARIDHPNVVTIHHIVDGGEGTYPWIVMELVGGGSLADRLERGPTDPVETARIGREVLAALRAAHDAGIQHRDVKPANVLLRPDGRPVLTDFGIAAIRESTALTATGSIIGTPDYMAPERIAGDDGGPASDLWSLAMMLYAAVEGHHPLRRGTTMATLAAVLYENVPPPRKAGPLADALMRVLVRDPQARPDAGTFDRMLTAVSAGAGVGTSAGVAAAPGEAVADAVPAARTEPTSYRLTPPQDAVPRSPGPAPVRPARRGRRAAVALSAVGTVLVGVLAWTLLPDSEGSGSSASGDSTNGATADPSADTSSTGTADKSPTPRRTERKTPTNLLTPDGIRTAVKALEKETGRDRYGNLTVYPEYVSAQVMVEGSRTGYQQYTYYVGRGVQETPIKAQLAGGAQPMTLDGLAWDRLPALLAEAEKKLNVDDATTRYLVVKSPNDLFDRGAEMLVYLSDEYNRSGYLQADARGKVTRVTPAD